MKHKVTIVLAAVMALAIPLWIAVLAGTGPPAGPNAQGGAPSVVSYQGQVTMGGSPYSGAGHFKFAIVGASGTTTYWSNDGTSTGGGEPTSGVELTVSHGLFHVLLGDTSLLNMTQPLGASVFGGTERYLRVWFSADGTTFHQLSPDRRIASVPYALQAANGVPSSAMVLGYTAQETTLIDAGFSYTGITVEADGWRARTAMPTKRYSLAASAVDGVIYVIGGWSNADHHLTTNESYDPATDTWTSKADMPTGRWGLATAVAEGVIYAIGGESELISYETANEAYYPITNTWATKSTMPTGRLAFGATTVDGVIYAVGGESSVAAYHKTNEAYYPITDTWTIKADMPTGRYGLAAVTVDGVLYAVGGKSSAGVYERANEAYDPATDTWANKADMPTGRYSLAAAAVDGVIYALGGWNDVAFDDPYLDTHEAYDTATNTWTTRAAMPTGRVWLAAAAVDRVVYAIGGYRFATVYDVNEAYTTVLYVYRKE